MTSIDNNTAENRSSKSIIKPLWIPPSCGFLNTATWRWDRIQSLGDVGDKPVFERSDDRYVVAGTAFWRMLHVDFTEEQQRTVYRRHPSMYEAHLLFTSASPIKWIVEALIVANAPPKYIATILGTSRYTPIWYEKIYFDVRERAKDPMFVALVLVKETNMQRLDWLPIDGLWKLLAKFLGPKILFDFIACGPMNEESKVGLKGWAESDMLKKVVAAGRSVPVNSHNIGDLLEHTGVSQKISAEERELTDRDILVMLKTVLQGMSLYPATQQERKRVETSTTPQLTGESDG